MRAFALVMLASVATHAGCGRADVYAITAEPAADGGAMDEGTPSPSCPSPVLPARDTTETLLVGSLSRSYGLHVPSSYDGKKPVPLILDFHAIGSSAANESTISPYPAVTDPEGVIVAFPDGIKSAVGQAWNMGPCCIADVDDLGFARALVSHLKEVACIDADRVYAVGVGTGSGMAYYLACDAADMFAAVAPAGFDLLKETADLCNPLRPITVISFRGTADTHVPYAGGAGNLVPNMTITFLGAKATFERWAKIDGCTGSPSEPDSDGCSTYGSCRGGVEVTLCTKEGGREEPGDASVAWPVLKRFSL